MGLAIENLPDNEVLNAVKSTVNRCAPARERVLIDNLLVQIHFIIVMIRWTGLAPWEF